MKVHFLTTAAFALLHALAVQGYEDTALGAHAMGDVAARHGGVAVAGVEGPAAGYDRFESDKKQKKKKAPKKKAAPKKKKQQKEKKEEKKKRKAEAATTVAPLTPGKMCRRRGGCHNDPPADEEQTQTDASYQHRRLTPPSSSEDGTTTTAATAAASATTTIAARPSRGRGKNCRSLRGCPPVDDEGEEEGPSEGRDEEAAIPHHIRNCHPRNSPRCRCPHHHPNCHGEEGNVVGMVAAE